MTGKQGITGKESSLSKTLNIGVSTPGFGTTASLGFFFPENKGEQSNNLSFTVFGVGLSVSNSEKGITGVSLSLSSGFGLRKDTGDMGVNFELLSK